MVRPLDEVQRQPELVLRRREVPQLVRLAQPPEPPREVPREPQRAQPKQVRQREWRTAQES